MRVVRPQSYYAIDREFIERPHGLKESGSTPLISALLRCSIVCVVMIGHYRNDRKFINAIYSEHQ